MGVWTPSTLPASVGKTARDGEAVRATEQFGGRADLQVGERGRSSLGFEMGSDFAASNNTFTEGLLGPVVGVGVRERDVKNLERMSGPRRRVGHVVEGVVKGKEEGGTRGR